MYAVVVTDAEFVGELLQAVEAARAEDDVRAVLHKVACGFGTEPEEAPVMMTVLLAMFSMGVPWGLWVGARSVGGAHGFV